MKLNDVDFRTPYNYSLFQQLNDNVTLSTLKKLKMKMHFLFVSLIQNKIINHF